MKLRVARAMVGLLSLALSLTPLTLAQTSTQTASALPRLVRFGGTVKDLSGNPLSGVVGITFALYSEQSGGVPLWLETQNVTADGNGHYAVLLGATKPEGLPAELFTSEQARWVGMQVSGQAEQPRVLLVSAPYALKAGDAETIGGLPPSAFVLAAPPAISPAAASDAAGSAAESVSPAATSDVTTAGGMVDAIPLFSAATSIQNSILTQTGTTAVNVGGKLNLPAAGTATATAGFDSRPQDFVASVFNSGTATAVPQTFQWQAEPLNNDKSTASGTLNLLYATGTATPAETGLKISNKGVFTFATGQAFPGTGTITEITTAIGSGLAGGGTSGTLSLKVPAAGISNAMLANSSLTLTPGGGMTGGGPVALGATTTLGLKTCTANQVLEFVSGAWACADAATGTVTMVKSGLGLHGGPITGSGTLSVDPTQVPLLSTENQFAANQNVTGSVSASSFSGNGSGLTNLQGANVQGAVATATNATKLNGLPASSYAITTGSNTFAGNQTFTGNISASGVSAKNSAAGASAVYGNNTATSGAGTNGGSFYSSSPAGAAVVGVNTSGGAAGYFEGPVTVTGNIAGGGTVAATALSATNSTAGASAVYGNNTATSGAGTNGGSFYSSSPGGAAVVGVNTSGGAAGYFEGPIAVTGSVAIGGDTPVSSNPRLIFSGFLSGTFCYQASIGHSCIAPTVGGLFIPDRAIVITRLLAGEAMQVPTDVGCIALASGNVVNDNGLLISTEHYVMTLEPTGTHWDSGPISVPLTAGTNIFIIATSYDGSFPGCTIPQGETEAGNVWVNVQYVMQ